MEGGCRALGSPPPPAQIALLRSVANRASSVDRLCSADSVGGVVHQRLDVLDRSQGVRGGPQQRGRHELAEVLAGRCPRNLDVRQVIDVLVREGAGRLVVAQQARASGRDRPG